VIVFTLRSWGCSRPGAQVARPPRQGLEQSGWWSARCPIVDRRVLLHRDPAWVLQAGGWSVQVRPAGGAAAHPGEADGSPQFAIGNYVSIFRAQESGALEVKFVADAYPAQRGHVHESYGRGGGRGGGQRRAFPGRPDLSGEEIAI